MSRAIMQTIQAAIDAAHDGNVVLVDEGTYYENINFKGKAITVASRFYMDGDTSSYFQNDHRRQSTFQSG